MPAFRPRLRPLLGPAVAALPMTLAWSTGLPAPAVPSTGPVTLTFPAPASGATARTVLEVASDDGHVVALVGASDARRRTLVELGFGRPARTIATFPRGAGHPTVGTDSSGRRVVLVRACSRKDRAGRSAGCGLQQVDVQTGRAVPLPGGAGARIGAIDRGVAVVARGATLTMVRPDDAGTGPNAAGAPALTRLPPLPSGQRGSEPASVDGLDLRNGVVAATVELKAAFGGSALVRYTPKAGWTALGVSTWGGAALGPRAFHAPEVTATGVRAAFDGARDESGYVARWGAGATPVEKVTTGRSGPLVFLRSAAFLGDRVVPVTNDAEPCLGTPCSLPAAGPFPLG